MLSKELEFTLNNAFKEAREKRYEFMTVEHLLLALLDNPTAAQVLRSCGGEFEFFAQHLTNLSILELYFIVVYLITGKTKPPPYHTLKDADCHVKTDSHGQLLFLPDLG